MVVKNYWCLSGLCVSLQKASKMYIKWIFYKIWRTCQKRVLIIIYFTLTFSQVKVSAFKLTRWLSYFEPLLSLHLLGFIVIESIVVSSHCRLVHCRSDTLSRRHNVTLCFDRVCVCVRMGACAYACVGVLECDSCVCKYVGCDCVCVRMCVGVCVCVFFPTSISGVVFQSRFSPNFAQRLGQNTRIFNKFPF